MSPSSEERGGATGRGDATRRGDVTGRGDAKGDGPIGDEAVGDYSCISLVGKEGTKESFKVS